MDDLTGIIVKGKGTAAGFVRAYTPLFEKSLGLTPFPGTLNVRVAPAPTLTGGTTLTPATGGAVICWDVIVNNKVRGFLVRPVKTTHTPDILEIIAPVNIREYFSLREGDTVHVRLL